jgi:hypothetical protein
MLLEHPFGEHLPPGFRKPGGLATPILGREVNVTHNSNLQHACQALIGAKKNHRPYAAVAARRRIQLLIIFFKA